MNGKGDKQRPTDKGKFDANFDAIFRKKDKKDEEAKNDNKSERKPK